MRVEAVLQWQLANGSKKKAHMNLVFGCPHTFSVLYTVYLPWEEKLSLHCFPQEEKLNLKLIVLH